MNLDDLKEIKESIYKATSIPKEYLDISGIFSVHKKCGKCQHFFPLHEYFYFQPACRLGGKEKNCPLNKMRKIW